MDTYIAKPVDPALLFAAVGAGRARRRVRTAAAEDPLTEFAAEGHRS